MNLWLGCLKCISSLQNINHSITFRKNNPTLLFSQSFSFVKWKESMVIYIFRFKDTLTSLIINKHKNKQQKGQVKGTFGWKEWLAYISKVVSLEVSQMAWKHKREYSDLQMPLVFLRKVSSAYLFSTQKYFLGYLTYSRHCTGL